MDASENLRLLQDLYFECILPYVAECDMEQVLREVHSMNSPQELRRAISACYEANLPLD
jgi:hypothetical protein